MLSPGSEKSKAGLFGAAVVLLAALGRLKVPGQPNSSHGERVVRIPKGRKTMNDFLVAAKHREKLTARLTFDFECTV